MRDFRLARILGFEVRIDASWFVIFFLVLWSFSVAVFPARVSGLNGSVYFTLGLIGSLLFFATLLAHELAHSIVARAKGIDVEGITLFVFGGVARTRSEARTPGDEFAIAGVGPLASVLIAIALFGLAVAGTSLGLGIASIALLEYIAMLNLALAIFNLLPGFPLDGGRMFRAIVWKITGSLRRATRVATTGGRWIGYGLVALGMWSALRGAVVGGLWLALIGWFLRNAAISTEREQIANERLEGVRADRVMTPVREITTPIAEEQIVSVDDEMPHVLERVRASPSHQVVVLDRGDIVGVITPGEIAAWLERARQLEILEKRVAREKRA